MFLWRGQNHSTVNTICYKMDSPQGGYGAIKRRSVMRARVLGMLRVPQANDAVNEHALTAPDNPHLRVPTRRSPVARLMHAQHLLQRIADGAERCRSASLTGPVDRDVCRTVMEALQEYMQARLSTPCNRCLCADLTVQRCCDADGSERQSSNWSGTVECGVSDDARIPSVAGILLDTSDACTRGPDRQRRCGAVVLASAGKLCTFYAHHWLPCLLFCQCCSEVKGVSLQASTDGSLVTLCSRLSSQPQVASAYAKQAPMRIMQPADLKAALLPLQVSTPICIHVTTPHLQCYYAGR